MPLGPHSEQTAKPKLIFCFVVSKKNYKPLKKALFKHVSTLVPLLTPEPGQRAVSLGEVIWRALRPEWCGAWHARQSIMMEVTQGNGFATTECGFYAYLASGHMMDQGFRDMAASGDRIMFCMAAPDTEHLRQAVNTHLDTSCQMVVVRISDRNSTGQEEWASEVENALTRVIEQMSAFADQESIISYNFAY